MATACSQCGKTAVVNLGNGAPLCVEHYSMFQAAMENQQRQNAAMINYLTAEMESVVGMPGLLPRLNMPERRPLLIQRGNVTFNNITVDRSIVGAINTAEVQHLDATLSHLHNSGDQAAFDAMRDLAQAIVSATSIDLARKNEMIEQMAYLSGEAIAPRERRKTSVIKSVFESIRSGASMVAELSSAWTKAEPVIRSIFGI